MKLKIYNIIIIFFSEKNLILFFSDLFPIQCNIILKIIFNKIKKKDIFKFNFSKFIFSKKKIFLYCKLI